MATTIDVKDMAKAGAIGFFDCNGIFHRTAKEAIEASKGSDMMEDSVSVSNRD